MTTILRKVPILSQPSTLHLAAGAELVVKSDQLILWMSVTASGLADFPLGAPSFPVVLDTGFNHTFLIGERQLEEWGGLRPHEEWTAQRYRRSTITA